MQLINAPKAHRLIVGLLVVFGLGVPLVLGTGVFPEILFPLASIGIVLSVYPSRKTPRECESKKTPPGAEAVSMKARLYAAAEAAVAAAMSLWIFLANPPELFVMNMAVVAVSLVFLFLSLCNEALAESTPEHWLLLACALAMDIVMILHQKRVYFAMVLTFALHQHPALEPSPASAEPAPGKVAKSKAWTEKAWVVRAWWWAVQLLKAGVVAVFLAESIRKQELAVTGIGAGAAGGVLAAAAVRAFVFEGEGEGKGKGQ